RRVRPGHPSRRRRSSEGSNGEGTETDVVGRQPYPLAHEYAMILHAAGAAICRLDQRGRITFVNPAASSLLGYEPHEMLGRPHVEVVCGSGEGEGAPSAGNGPSYCDFREPWSTGVRTGEDVYRRKDGTPLRVQYACTPIVEDGRLKGAVLVFQDITQRKELERERERLLTLVEESPHFVSTCDADGRILYVNKAGRRLMGIPDGEDLRGWRLTPESLAIISKVTEKGVWHGRRTRFLEPYRGEGKGITAMQTAVAHRGGDGAVEFYSTIAI